MVVGPGIKGILFPAMVAAALAYGFMGLANFWAFFGAYDGVAIGSTPAEVVYLAGKPNGYRATPDSPWQKYDESRPASEWLYSGNGRNLAFSFEDGRVSQIFCGSGAEEASNCAPVLAVSIGTYEWDVLHELGLPDSEGIANGRKVLNYRDVGYSFVLEQSRVRGIMVYRNDEGGFELLKRFLFWMMP